MVAAERMEGFEPRPFVSKFASFPEFFSFRLIVHLWRMMYKNSIAWCDMLPGGTDEVLTNPTIRKTVCWEQSAPIRFAGAASYRRSRRRLFTGKDRENARGLLDESRSIGCIVGAHGGRTVR